MDKAKALEILAKYCPEITLAAAGRLIAELSDLKGTPALTPEQWTESVFSWTDKNTRKIGMIKEVRNRFSLGLKEAKDIVDACNPRSAVDFFPPRVDNYGF